MQGSSAYQALQQSLYEECQRRLQRDAKVEDLRKQVASAQKQASCWEKAAESGAARIAQLQDDIDKEKRWCLASCHHGLDNFARPAGYRWPAKVVDPKLQATMTCKPSKSGLKPAKLQP